MDKNEIVKKQFSRAFRGYDIVEVDAFLDEIIREFDRYGREKELLQLKIEGLEAQLAKEHKKADILPEAEVEKLIDEVERNRIK